MVKVSVVLPVYNPGEGVRRCIESLRGQTLRDIEMIFVDDRGTDGAMAVIEAAAREDARIRVLKNDVNRGAGYSRNRGIEAAQGEYLSFVDPDDYAAPDFLEKLYRATEPGKPDIVKGERAMIDMEGRGIPERGTPLSRHIREGMAQGKPQKSEQEKLEELLEGAAQTAAANAARSFLRRLGEANA